MGSAGEKVLIMIAGFIVSTIIALVIAVIVGMILMTFVDSVIGVIVGVIVAIVVFILGAVVTWELVKGEDLLPKEGDTKSQNDSSSQDKTQQDSENS